MKPQRPYMYLHFLFVQTCTYVGEPGEYDALMPGDAGHCGEWAAPWAGDRCHGGRLGGRSCCEQVTLQHDNPLVIN
jgi:hypothetical protein